MARKKSSRAAENQTAPPTKPQPSAARPHTLAILLLVAATLVFHGHALFGSKTSIQWDAVDVHYTQQKYFADQIREGPLPHWTPYIFSGYPFLADPQTGAWYPLNWPFFLLGVTPASIQTELALHTLIAALGAYLFAWRRLGQRGPSLVAAFAYAFSGFFAGHASHVGMFQTAAWLPWILLAVERATGDPRVAPKAAAGLLTGVMLLAGHFQTALYIGFAVVLFCGWLILEERARWKATAITLGVTGALGAAIAAVMIIPGIELLQHSVRAAADFSSATNSPLVPGALGTLLYPNLFSAIEGKYTGPADITQHYLYGGLLLLPLAALGLRDRGMRGPSLVLVVPLLWYAFGPAGGLYTVLSKLPGLGSVRAPVHIWFAVAFGLALLAAAGLREARARWSFPWLVWVIPVLLFSDLFYFNSAANPLAYARQSFAELYGNRLSEFQQRLSAQLPALTRFHAPRPLQAFGPQNHPLDARTETTYGYNPLMLTTYTEYFGASARNPKLLAELGAKFRLDPQAGSVHASDDVMARVTVPKQVVAVRPEEAASRLAALDPREAALSAGPAVSSQDSNGTATVVDQGPGRYRISYKVASPSLVRVAEVYYPGWQATSGGAALEVFPVDRALTGFIVPAGEGEVDLRFRLRNFNLAAGISLGAAIAAGVLLLIHVRSE
jgi:hypothetical protein